MKIFPIFQFCDGNNTLEIYYCYYNVICLSRQMQENTSLMIFPPHNGRIRKLHFFILRFLGKVISASILHSFSNTAHL